jgi:hypothetical protein
MGRQHGTIADGSRGDRQDNSALSHAECPREIDSSLPSIIWLRIRDKFVHYEAYLVVLPQGS